MTEVAKLTVTCDHSEYPEESNSALSLKERMAGLTRKVE